MGDLKKLSDPFPGEDIEWFITSTTKDKQKGLAVPFITARAAQDRLDEVVGPNKWKNRFIEWKNGAQLCEILIFDDDTKEWIGKVDGSGDTDIEGIKGGLSASFKRSASVWGIGRYLYYLESPWVEIEQRGKSYVIKPNQQIVLPGWALPGGSGKPGINDNKEPTVKVNGYNYTPTPQQQPSQPAPHSQQQYQQPAPQSQPQQQQQYQQPAMHSQPQQMHTNNRAGKLSPKQVDRAIKKGQAANQTVDQILLWIKQKYGVQAIEDLNRQQYDELCAALDRARVQ